MFRKRKETINQLKWEIEQLWELVDCIGARINIEGYIPDSQKPKQLLENKNKVVNALPFILSISGEWLKDEKAADVIQNLQYYAGLKEIDEEQIYKIKYCSKTIEETIENYLLLVKEIDEKTHVKLGVIYKNKKIIITKNLGGLTYEKFN